MIRKVFQILSLLLMLFIPAGVSAADDIEQHRSCARCGMDRKAYGYSRMLIQFENGRTVGVCSIHCAVQELVQDKEMAVQLLVGDRSTHELIDAKQAVWILGGRKRGVMTKTPKWAFKTEAAADEFIRLHGGKIVTWEEAEAAAREEIAGRHEK